LLHTIDNNKPLFDSGLAILTNIKPKGSDRDAKIHSCLKIYDYLQTLYAELKENDKIRKVISKFRSKFRVDDEKMSDTKVLDFIMWSLGKLKKRKIKQPITERI
jgi:mRNA deadenylase 3'-5' endonuclease subunit Ccr4